MDGRFFNREGCLISGFRPAIILSNDLNNRNFECQIATVITLTTSLLKGGFETRIKIKANSNTNSLKSDSVSLIEQITTVNKENVRFCLGRLSDCEIELINNALKEFLNFK